MIAAMALGRPGSSFTSVSVGSVLPTQGGTTKQHAAASGPLLPVKVGGCTCCKSLKKSASKMWCSSPMCSTLLGSSLEWLCLFQIMRLRCILPYRKSPMSSCKHTSTCNLACSNRSNSRLCTSDLEIQHQHPRKGLERLAAPSVERINKVSPSATATKNRNQNFRSFKPCQNCQTEYDGHFKPIKNGLFLGSLPSHPKHPLFMA